MHMGDMKAGVVSIISALAATVPVAAGAALALRYQGKNGVAFSYFGDGATSRGDWHEGVNFATVQKLPVVFICNNNQYAYSTPLNLQMACANVADRGPAYNMPAEIVDGNDVMAVYEATAARGGTRAQRPGPVSAGMQDLPHDRPLRARSGPLRTQGACSRSGSKLDPIVRLEKRMLDEGWAQTERDLDARVGGDQSEVDDAVAWARPEPVPDPATLLDERVREPITMPTTYLEAIREGLWEEMERDPNVFCIGEDIGEYGGAFKVTAGFLERFGAQRVVDTPISEAGDCGRGHRRGVDGAAAGGGDAVRRLHLLRLRPDCEFRGQVPVPLGCAGVRSWSARPRAAGFTADRSTRRIPEMWFVRHSGLKVVCPATAYDAKGLIKSAIRDNDPVMFFEHKGLYRKIKEDLPDEDYTVPIGKAKVVREGRDLSIITYGAMVWTALEAADQLAGEGCERGSGGPAHADAAGSRDGVREREEDVQGAAGARGHAQRRDGGRTGGDDHRRTSSNIWTDPIVRVTAPDTPVPFSPPLEEAFLPNVEKVLEKARWLHRY